jgi:hypothetical protein
MRSRLTPSGINKLFELLKDRALGWAAGEDYVEWAWSMQEAGLDTPHLRILAGQDWPFDRWELDRYFLQTLADLEIELPPNDVPLRQCVYLMARCIVKGVITPAEGCRNIALLARSSYYTYATPELQDELRFWDMLEVRQISVDEYGEEHFYGKDEDFVSTIMARAKALLASSFCASGI